MYIERDLESNIIKTFSRKQYEGQEFLEGAIVPNPDVKKITKLQAVTFFQNNDIYDQVETLLDSNPDLKARYSASHEFAIDNPDIATMSPAVEALTGKDLQTMFNEAAGV